MNNLFYVADLLVATLSLTAMWVLFLKKKISHFLWYLFWIGSSLGFIWEFLCEINIAYGTSFKVAHFFSPPPVHFMLWVIVHSIWDGGLFIIGVMLVHKLTKGPHFREFSWLEFSILLIWGQLQELALEMISIYAGAWEWLPSSWNPTLFKLNGHYITLLPQLIWAIATLVFYPIAILLRKRL